MNTDENLQQYLKPLAWCASNAIIDGDKKIITYTKFVQTVNKNRKNPGPSACTGVICKRCPFYKKTHGRLGDYECTAVNSYADATQMMERELLDMI